jgi:uncharacterized HAD superfamily protein/adenine/guanine phosphoribosyltransferase-like PRPP-binding protein
MQYRSIRDLNNAIHSNLHRLPSDIDVVVGIPRSGLLVANIIALALNLRLAELGGFTRGRLIDAGKTRRRRALDIEYTEVKHALIVDDSIHTGTAIADTRQALAHLSGKMKLTYAVAYKPKETVDPDVIAFETVPMPRVFEWNLFHHPVLRSACVDIDGVLCHDPADEENDDGSAYVQFLLNARPRYLPTQTIGHLVTSRLEKYRAETEAWLARRNIAYERLVMLDLPDANTRRQLGMHGRFKGEYYRRVNSPLFIESEAHQAAEIAKVSGKPVLCTADQTIYHPNSLSPLRVAQTVRHTDLKRLARLFLGPVLSKRVKRLLAR